jgi:hypothetical protein
VNWRNVLPFGVPETTGEIFASVASAFLAGVIGAALLVGFLIWIGP